MASLSQQNAPATPKQLFALFCGTGLKTTNCNISINTASNLIADMKAGIDITDDLRRYGATGEVKKKLDCQGIYDKAHAAGMEAVNKLNVVPMTVVGHANPLDDNSPVTERYFVADGVCGFANVVVKPANSAFAKFLVSKKLASKHYAGGVSMYVHFFNQSYQKKQAYAQAFAKVLKDSGIKAYAESRLD